MKFSTRSIAHAALIGAMYLVLTHLQNLIFPDSTSMAIQCRLSEALCVLALFTPAAIPGLTAGCLLFNLTFSGTLPLDFLLGSAATAGAALSMWALRNVTVKGYPLPAMLMPAAWNALLIGWELTHYIGMAFSVNALFVAIGELIVLLIPGTVLFYAMKARNLPEKIFGKR